MNKTNIVLVGFMGTGKTATGRLVALRLERSMVDMDTMIEGRAGRKIMEIFARDGETRFRELERQLVVELSARKNLVITAGGGVVLNPDNIRDFGRTGVVICLKASPTAILQRVRSESHRPLLEGGDKARKLLELLEARKPLYEAIPLQIDTTHLSPESAAARVVEIYQQAVKEDAGGTPATPSL
ncbi:MAG: shikimate kinase [Verrucomicrobiota bacterium]